MKYDLVLGTPSYNTKDTIGFVAEQLALGLEKYYPGKKAVIINVDGGSTDGTPEAFMETKIPRRIDRESHTYSVIAGKGEALRKLFEKAVEYGAEACLTVDSDLQSIEPKWVKSLLSPILKGYDLVAPYYARHKNDGTITRNFAYPLIFALYGRNLRQPIGGDFGFSSKLAENWLSKKFWDSEILKFGIDIFMTTVALAEKFKVCQTWLGAKIHDPKDPRGLGPMFSQVSATAFSLIRQYEGVWKKSDGPRKIALFGRPKKEILKPIPVKIDLLISEFRKGFRKFRGIYQNIFYQSHLEALSRAAEGEPEKFKFPIELWAKITYDFASEFEKGTINKKDLLDAFQFLYFGRIASYLMEVADLEGEEVEEYTHKIAQVFRDNRGYLFRRWHGIKPAVDEWFVKNRFHYSDFSNLHRLVKLKQQKKLSIGLCLPAKNEEETIAGVIKALKKPLTEDYPLLDELVVVDNQSTDRTVKIIQDLGVPVYQVKEILPEIETPKESWGKGENLWRSIYLLNSDILIWLDTDVYNMDPRFVYGLVGPLLKRDDLGFIKAFYKRPLRIDKQIIGTGGGRVQELTVRPLLNTFYPDLSQILTPLSGEYAVRREIIEQIPICTNYALETCMLVDIYTKFGLDIIGQADLLERIHRNKPLSALSKLAFGIIQAVFNRLHIHAKVKLLREPKEREGKYNFEAIQIIEAQRPPMIEIPAYQEKFKDRVSKWRPPVK